MRPGFRLRLNPGYHIVRIPIPSCGNEPRNRFTAITPNAATRYSALQPGIITQCLRAVGTLP